MQRETASLHQEEGMYCPVLRSNWDMYFRQVSISSTSAVSLNRYLRISRLYTLFESREACVILEGTSRGLLARSHRLSVLQKFFRVAGLLSRHLNTARKASLKANRTHPAVNLRCTSTVILAIQSNGAWHNMDIHLDSMHAHAWCKDMCINLNLKFGETLI